MRREPADLPSDVSSFVGRKKELATLRDQLGSTRLLTLTGPGGVGKTRLALKVAAESRRAFPDGVRLLELADINDASLLPEALAAALGLKQTAGSPLEQMRRHLAQRRTLIVLDGCEHLVDFVAILLSDLLRSAPEVRFVVTSRHSLGLVGERLFTVPPLSIPDPDRNIDPEAVRAYDGVALLVERATDHVPGFAVTADNAASLSQLCARLDGLPLAIELAAARLRTLSVDDLLKRLDQRFRLLVGNSAAALPRQQTLRALIDWSYTLCSPDEQTLLARLSVFSGGFDLAAVEEICSDESLPASGMVDLVDSLVRKSIVTLDASPRHVRYRMLESIREYAAERLIDGGGSEASRTHHCDYYTKMAVRAARAWCGGDQASWLGILKLEHPNLRAAFDHAAYNPSTQSSALAMTVALQWHWIAGGFLAEGRRWLRRVLGPSPAQPTAEAVDAMWLDAYLALLQGDLATAHTRLDQAAGAATQLGSVHADGFIAQVRGMAALFSGDLETARSHYEAALACHEGNGDDGAVVSFLFQLAVTYTFCGEASLAAASCDRSIQLSEQYGERWGRSYALWALAVNGWLEGALEGAEVLARRSLEITIEFDDQLGIAHLVGLLGWIAASEGDAEHGARLLGLSDALRKELGTPISAFGPHLADCHVRSLERLRRQLGDEEFRAAMDVGASMESHRVVMEMIGGAEAAAAPLQNAWSTSPLTPREQQVAALIAKGLSNKEIAAVMVVSTRTVDSHVQHVLAKLGFRSRTQIAAWVAER